MDAIQNTLISRKTLPWKKSDTVWMLGLYGTAIGAGVLFLPINAGTGGLLPLIIMALLAFPMTFFAHRGLTRFVLSGRNPGEDITEVVEEHFGTGAGKLITLLYFLLSTLSCWFIAWRLPILWRASSPTSFIWSHRRVPCWH